jgi:hypothetical protein
MQQQTRVFEFSSGNGESSLRFDVTEVSFCSTLLPSIDRALEVSFELR